MKKEYDFKGGERGKHSAKKAKITAKTRCPNCGKTLETHTQVHNCMVEKPLPSFEVLCDRYTLAYQVGKIWKVAIKIGVQEFQLGLECDTQEEADWFRFMLGKAFHELLKKEGK